MLWWSASVCWWRTSPGGDSTDVCPERLSRCSWKLYSDARGIDFVSVSASSGIGPPSMREERGRLSLFEPGGNRRAVWERFRADRFAFASLIVLALVVLVCFAGEPVARALLGHGPNDPFRSAVDVNLNPAGPFTLVRDTRSGVPKSTAPQTLFLLGADGPLGRDEFLRLLAGGR